MANPKYKVTSKEVIHIDGRLLSPGAEYESIGWPPDVGVEPINPEAEMVAQFKKENSFHPMCGERTSAYCAKYGTIFLPHLRKSPVDPETVSADAPRYSAPYGAEFQTRDIAPGQTFVFLSWPQLDWKPENPAGRQVKAWLEKHADDPRVPAAPWNSFNGELLLPHLEPIKDPRKIATDIVPFETSPHQKEIERYVNRPRRGAKRQPAAARR